MRDSEYDLIVIGGGAAGMVSSKLAAGLGKKVALVERALLGGECTQHGCIPSKAPIKAANIYHQATNIGRLGYGLSAPSAPAVSTEQVMEHVRHVVREVYEGGQPEAFRAHGIEVIFGSPLFSDNHHIQVGGRTLFGRTFIISTGSSAFIPPIEGMDRVPYLTNEGMFELEKLPQSMIVLGGGPIGIELAQALNRLGVDITVVEMGDRILIREEKDLTDLLAQKLTDEGLKVLTRTKAMKLSTQEGLIHLQTSGSDGSSGLVRAETILVAVGRQANVGGLKLENAGVSYSPKGITVDDTLKTTAPNIYACGDVVGPYQFSHMAEYQARIAAQNAVLPIKKHADYDHYIWCMFTDPELAHAGLTEDEARQRHGDDLRVYKWSYGETDRGKTDVEKIGFSKIICDRRYKVLGAHIVGSRAGDLIHEVQIIKTLGIPLYKLDSVIQVYPTFYDVIKQPAKMSHIEKLKGNPLLRLLNSITAPFRK